MVVVDVWRMMHSSVRRLDYLVALGRSLQDLVRYVMDTDKYLMSAKDDVDKDIERVAAAIDLNQLVRHDYSSKTSESLLQVL